MPIFETRFNRKMPEAFDTSKSSIPVRIGVIRTTRPSWRNCVNLRVRRDALGNAGGNSGELFRVFGGLLLDQFLRFSHPSERGSDREPPPAFQFATSGKQSGFWACRNGSAGVKWSMENW